MIRSSVELIEVVSSIHLGTQKLPTMNQETLKLTKLGLRVQSHLNNEKSMFVVNKSFNLWTFKNQSKLRYYILPTSQLIELSFGDR